MTKGKSVDKTKLNENTEISQRQEKSTETLNSTWLKLFFCFSSRACELGSIRTVKMFRRTVLRPIEKAFEKKQKRLLNSKVLESEKDGDEEKKTKSIGS